MTPDQPLVLNPLRGWLHATLMRGASETTPGGVALPQAETASATDALILAVGPEVDFLAPGDRVLALPHDVLLVDWQRYDVLIDARNVTAYNCGPAWEGWQPAHDWVLARHEQPVVVDAESGCVVERETAGRILVATHSAVGQQGRLLVRGEELLGELMALRESPRFLEAATQGPFLRASSGEVLSYEQDRILNDFTGRLPRDEQEALIDALERDDAPSLGALAPQRWRFGSDRGQVLAKGPACREEQVRFGERVLWDANVVTVVIGSSGRTLVKERDLSGVLE